MSPNRADGTLKISPTLVRGVTLALWLSIGAQAKRSEKPGHDYGHGAVSAQSADIAGMHRNMPPVYMVEQSLEQSTMWTIAFLGLIALGQLLWTRSRAKVTLKSVGLCACVAYAYVDLGIWIYHAFVDRDETLSLKAPWLPEAVVQALRSASSASIHNHHPYPTEFRISNEVKNLVEPMIVPSIWIAIGASPLTSVHFKIWTVFVCVFLVVCLHNHSCCHAKIHGALNVPTFYSTLQSLGALPWPELHRVHHQTESEKWYFLFGPSIVADHLYVLAGGWDHKLMVVLVVLSNPIPLHAFIAFLELLVFLPRAYRCLMSMKPMARCAAASMITVMSSYIMAIMVMIMM